MKAKFFKFIAVSVSVLLTAVVVSNVVINSTLQTEAAENFQGVQKLIEEVQQENAADSTKPYTILEIVPSAAEGEMGYFFEEFEPALSEWDAANQCWIGWRERLGKCADRAGRTDLVNQMVQALKDAYAARGIALNAGPVSILSETYEEVSAPEEGFEKLEIGFASRYGYFVKKSSPGEGYNLVFVQALGAGNAGEAVQCYYRAAGTQITADNQDALTDETPVYKQEGSSFIYQGKWGDVKDEAVSLITVSQNNTDSVSAGNNNSGMVSDNSSVTGAYTASVSDNTVFSQEPAATVLPGYYTVEFVRLDAAPADGTPYYVVDTTAALQKSASAEYDFVSTDEGSVGAQFYDFSEETVYFKTIFKNNEWFKKSVLNMEEEAYDSFPVNIISLTPDEINSNSIPEFNFLSIKDCGSMDLQDIKAKQLLYEVESKALPCVVDGAILFDGTGNVKTSSTNLLKLCLVLAQESVLSTNLEKVSSALAATLSDGWEEGTFATNQVYVLKRDTSIINSKFASPDIYGGSGEIQDGFRKVLDEIELENLYRESEGFVPLPKKISQATVISYIMNYQNRRDAGVKKNIQVLELQPAKTASKLNPQKVMEWAPGVETVETTVMTTAEFIGKIDTLNDKYDMIYIGASLDSMNVEGNVTVYNNSDLTGLIYHRTGDICGGEGQYNGNDITLEKKAALLSFLNGNCPIVADDALMVSQADKTWAVNAAHVEPNSVMYEFLDAAKAYKNFYIYSDIEANEELLQYYLYQSKVSVEAVSLANAEVKEGYTRLRLSEDGKYHLEYQFTVGQKEGEAGNPAYQCQFYLDFDGNQRLTEADAVNGFTIAENGTAVSQLLIGHTYVLTTELPGTYAGNILAWKLKVFQEQNAEIYGTAVGYTKLVGLEPEELKILQLSPKGENALDLGACIRNPGNIFYELAREIKQDYDIQVTFCTLDEYADTIRGNTAKAIAANPDYLKQFHILILGFSGEPLSLADEDLIQPVREFADSGKGIVFTHDTSDFKEEKIKSQTYGKTYNSINKGANRGKYLNINRDDILLQNQETNLITQENSGVITSYPFLVQNIGTALTHGQTYGLDYDLDENTDGYSDIVTWYCLDSKYVGEQRQDTAYSLSPNDVRNNYYLYTHGNITYSGFGASVGGSEEEAKLFLNTLITTYHNSIRPPDIKILEGDDPEAPEMAVMYRYFDGEVMLDSDAAVSKEKIYFTVRDTNIACENLLLATRFFYEKEGVSGTDSISCEGVRSVSPLDGNVYDAVTGGQIMAAEDGSRYLVSGRVYYIEVSKSLLADCEEGLKLFFEAQSSFRLGTKEYQTEKVYAKLDVLKTYLFDLN